jgi:signal transduction histidine kinase/ActR/RegA family two-component response regulator
MEPTSVAEPCLADLPFCGMACSPNTLAVVCIEAMDASPTVGGLIVEVEGRPYVISRQRALKLLASEFGRGLFLGRPISLMVKHVPEPLILQDQTSLTGAVAAAVARPPEHVFEPIVVQREVGGFDIVELRQVLLAQSDALRAAQGAALRLAESALAASRAKGEFLANVSHEIRTPMTAILGFVELVAETLEPEDERAAWIDIVRANGQHLLSIINDVLDLSKVESGRMALERIAVDPAALLEGVRKLVEHQAREKGLDLLVEVEYLPAAVLADPVRLRQVVVNLVGNAVKFTDVGQVVLRARHDGRRLWVEIQDTGPGIQLQAMKQLFEPFMQADASSTRRNGGTGLGLAISRRLARMMGGDIDVVSAAGRGSLFRAVIDAPPVQEQELPLAAPQHQASPRPPSFAAGTRILVVDDMPMNRRLLRLILERAGCVVDEAENGRAALARIDGAQRPYDGLLLDMQMPELDGYEVAKHLRQSGSRLPIIALTAHAMDGDRAPCLEAGCDEYATKPIEAPVLLELLARVLSRTTASRVA